MGLKGLIVGCGRSGTGFVANYLTDNGLPSGHEDLFDVYGCRVSNSELEYESSWYAVPYLQILDPSVRILHVVRHPEKVAASFFRIGLFDKRPWQHITKGNAVKFASGALLSPGAAVERIEFVRAHRRFLRRHLDLPLISDEIMKLQSYWAQWNSIIEQQVEAKGFPYLRVKIEDFNSRRSEIDAHFSLDGSRSSSLPRNEKIGYVRKSTPTFSPTLETFNLMTRYGYD